MPTAPSYETVGIRIETCRITCRIWACTRYHRASRRLACHWKALPDACELYITVSITIQPQISHRRHRPQNQMRLEPYDWPKSRKEPDGLSFSLRAKCVEQGWYGIDGCENLNFPLSAPHPVRLLLALLAPKPIWAGVRLQDSLALDRWRQFAPPADQRGDGELTKRFAHTS